MAQSVLGMHTEPLDKVRKIKAISGENVQLCMQCGTCSAVCPMVESMNATPRQIMHLLQFGLTDEVLETRSGEICASCHTCSVRCPRGIDVARALETARLLALRHNVDLIHPNRISQDTLRQAPQIACVAAFRKLTA